MEKSELVKMDRKALLAQRRKLIENLPHLYGFKWYPWARKFFDSTNKINLLVAGNQLSKALDVDTLIPTPNGFKKLRDIQIGDEVFSKDGSTTKVIDIPFFGEDECFEFIFSDGKSIVASSEHEWYAKGHVERFRKHYISNWRGQKGKKTENPDYGKWNIYDTKTIIDKGSYHPETKPTKKFVLPINSPVEYPVKEFILDPYLVGILIGNGSLIKDVAISLNCQDTDIEKYLVSLGGVKHNIGANKISIRFNRSMHPTIIKFGLNKYSHEKVIPKEYLYGDIAQRKRLLAGLMDTDGTIDRKGQSYNYSSTSYALIKQINELVCSLGGICQEQFRGKGYYYNTLGEKVICKEHWVLTLWTTFNPFLSNRKAAKWKYNQRYKHEHVIDKILPIGKRKVKCITVEDASGLFLATENFIVTHNSSSQIRKAIHWATCPKIWPKLWITPPKVFWYLYPSKEVADVEFSKKWIPEFMPREDLVEHPVYGWKAKYRDGHINEIIFNSGVSVYFKTYMQSPQLLQTGTVHAIFCDEELPTALFDELMFRLAASDGYFHMVFTATLNQDFWRRAVEEIGTKNEVLPEAFKQQISMYDCMYYEDGSKSMWTNTKIEQIKQSCSTDNEVLRRVMGRFVRDEGLIYTSFSRGVNVVEAKWEKPPEGWLIYAGVDIGSGGSAHPAAICFIAVRPDFKYGEIFKGWRGNKNENTTTSDILNTYKRLRGDLKPTMQTYDWQSKDFYLVAAAMGENFTPAEKGKHGEETINSLFKNRMLAIQDRPELSELIFEINSVYHGADKAKAKDDFVDAMRFCVTRVPWDWDLGYVEEKVRVITDVDEIRRRREMFDEDKEVYRSVEQELMEWNDLYEV